MQHVSRFDLHVYGLWNFPLCCRHRQSWGTSPSSAYSLSLTQWSKFLSAIAACVPTTVCYRLPASPWLLLWTPVLQSVQLASVTLQDKTFFLVLWLEVTYME